MSIAKLILVLALVGCSHTPAEQAVGDAIALYNQGKDDAAIRLLTEASQDDASGLAQSKLADIYILRGYFSRDVSQIRSGLAYAEKIEKARPRQRSSKSEAYRDYFKAMTEDVQGDSNSARSLVSMHCTPNGDCDLVQALSDNALIDGSRYDAEVVNAVSSLLLKFQMESDNVLAANLSSQALLNYPKAEEAVKALKAADQLSSLMHDRYCRSIRLLPMLGKTPSAADQADCVHGD